MFLYVLVVVALTLVCFLVVYCADPHEESAETKAGICTSILALTSALAMIWACRLALSSRAIRTVDHLVEYNAMWLGATSDGWEEIADEIPVFTTQRIVQSLLVCSYVIVLASILGVAGALLRRKGLVCTYVILASCLSVVVLVGAAQIWQTRLLATPLLTQQVLELCNTTTYVELTTSLGCPLRRPYLPSEVVPCDEACAFRVASLQRLDGCTELPMLCKRFTYQRLPPALCLDAANRSDTAYEYVRGKLRFDACRAECDIDIGCDTFVHKPSEACILLSGLASQHSTTTWHALRKESLAQRVPRGWEQRCYRRVEPMVLRVFTEHGRKLATATSVLGAMMFLSTACTWLLMYNVNINRKGKPTAVELGLMMMCPCCSQQLHRRFHGDPLAEEEASSDAHEDSVSSETLYDGAQE